MCWSSPCFFVVCMDSISWQKRSCGEVYESSVYWRCWARPGSFLDYAVQVFIAALAGSRWIIFVDGQVRKTAKQFAHNFQIRQILIDWIDLDEPVSTCCDLVLVYSITLRKCKNKRINICKQNFMMVWIVEASDKSLQQKSNHTVLVAPSL